MLYADESDRYFECEETAADFYFGMAVEEVPEWLYGVQDYRVPKEEIEKGMKALLDCFDEIPELRYEDAYFSDTVSDEDSDLLFDLISTWASHTMNTVIPDYDNWIEFRPIYKEYCDGIENAKRIEETGFGTF